jgi:hypothetical protein
LDVVGSIGVALALAVAVAVAVDGTIKSGANVMSDQ